MLELVSVGKVAAKVGSRLKGVEARVIVVPLEGGEFEGLEVDASAESFVKWAGVFSQCEEGSGGCCSRSAILSLLFASLVLSQ